MGIPFAEAFQEKASAERSQLECLEKPLLRCQPSKYPDILPVIGAAFGIGEHGMAI
jgi:hypothetical protein